MIVQKSVGNLMSVSSMITFPSSIFKCCFENVLEDGSRCVELRIFDPVVHFQHYAKH